MSLKEPYPECVVCHKEIAKIEEFYQSPLEVETTQEGVKFIKKTYASYHKRCYKNES